jgi:CBS domain-containing protein
MRNGLVRNWMTVRVITVAPETQLNDARRIMDAEKIRHLPVVSNQCLVGIITRRGLLRADLSPLSDNHLAGTADLPVERVAALMTANPITTGPDSALPKAARVMLENKITALPVVDEQHNLLGILTSSDIFRALISELPFLKETILVKDYLTAHVISITPDTSLLEAHRLMGVERIRALPVLDGDHLVGIITRTDLMSADPSRLTGKHQQEVALKIQTQSVERIMSRSLITVSPEAAIIEAARLMLENKIHALPVLTSEKRMIGILTESDLFRLTVKKFF